MNEQAVGNLVVAGDLGTTDVVSVTLKTNLDEALRIFTQKNLDELPVVEPDQGETSKSISTAVRRPRGPVGTMQVVGMLSRRDLIAAYHRRMQALQSAETLDNAGSHVIVDALAVVAISQKSDLEELREEIRENMAPRATSAEHPEPELLEDPPEHHS
jgi:hypothetical protein